MVTEQEIAEAEAAKQSAYAVYQKAKSHYEILKTQQASEQFGIHVGMRVINRHGKCFVVSRIQSYGKDSKPWLYGKLVKKDGTVGIREICIFSNWTVIES